MLLATEVTSLVLLLTAVVATAAYLIDRGVRREEDEESAEKERVAERARVS